MSQQNGYTNKLKIAFPTVRNDGGCHTTKLKLFVQTTSSYVVTLVIVAAIGKVRIRPLLKQFVAFIFMWRKCQPEIVKEKLCDHYSGERLHMH